MRRIVSAVIYLLVGFLVLLLILILFATFRTQIFDGFFGGNANETTAATELLNFD